MCREPSDAIMAVSLIGASVAGSQSESSLAIRVLGPCTLHHATTALLIKAFLTAAL